MTEREFSQKLRRGFGSAILELKENPDRDKYRDIVLRCCFRDILAKDEDYLYSAICALDDKDYFEKILCDRYLSRCPNWLFFRLHGLLSHYANDGSEPAKDAMRSKYAYFAAKNGRLAKTSSSDEGYQWDRLAFSLLSIDGFEAFKRYTLDLAELLRKNPKTGVYDYGWLLRPVAEVQFGMKRTNHFLDRMCDESPAVRALLDKVKEKNDKRKEARSRVPTVKKITVDALLHAAREAVLNKAALRIANSPAELSPHRGWFVKNASDDEVLELANAILRENDETVKGLLLSNFLRTPLWGKVSSWYEPFPLLEYARSANKILSGNAIALLADFEKDKTIHDTAIQLLEEKGLDSGALVLLVENYRKADDAVIHRLIKKASAIPHHALMNIGEIYRHHRSVNALPILLRGYQKADGEICRHFIVEAMKHCGVLPDDILEECLYDSYYDIRTMAERIKRARRARKKLNSEI